MNEHVGIHIAQEHDVPLSDVRKSVRTVLAGSIAEGVVGGGVIVLSIVGLSNILPALMLNIAAIAMGAALLLEGGAISLRFTDLLKESHAGRLQEAEFGVGVTVEFMGGVAGIVLGVLSLVSLAPMVLVPVAVIVFGATLMLGSGATVRLNALEMEGSSQAPRLKRITHEAVSAAAGVQMLLGLSAVTLGIIAITGTATLTLSLTALLIVGVSGFLDAAAISARMMSVSRS
jgi:hypothetical protein